MKPAARAATGSHRRRFDRSSSPREVERLQNELGYSPHALAAVVGRVAQNQLVAGAGHTHVAKPPLLLQMGVAFRQDLLDQVRGQAQRLTPRASREAAVHQADHEHHRKLEPLALCTVRTATASASGSSSAVAGSSPASISVCKWRATNTNSIVREQI